jgi:uncharacterized protein YkwD
MVSLVTHWLKPHYSNNHRAKLLQPTGLVALTIAFLLVQSSLQLLRLSPSLPGGIVLGYASSISAAQVLEQTNNERTKAGLPALTTNTKLNQAALAKASHMFQHDYWAHIAPDGTTPWVFIKNAGYSYSVAGENLARDFGDTGAMVQAWMNSPTHKENIVRSKYTETGIAVVDGKLQGVETTLVVQLFGSPSVAGAKTTSSGAQSDKVTSNAEKAAPNPTPIVVSEPVPEAALTPITVQAEPALEINQNTTQDKTVISPLTVTKFLASGLVALLILVLTYDLVLSSKQNLPRRVGNNWAHIGLFSVVLLVIIMMTQGRVL